MEGQDFLRENTARGGRKHFPPIFIHKPGICLKVRTSEIFKGKRLAAPCLQRKEKVDGERVLGDPKEGKQPEVKRTTFRAIELQQMAYGGEGCWCQG